MVTTYITRSSKSFSTSIYRAFSHDVTAAMLVFQNKGMAAMMVYQTNPLGFDFNFNFIEFVARTK